jgi:L-methionine (R)-S-oxide reductase
MAPSRLTFSRSCSSIRESRRFPLPSVEAIRRAAAIYEQEDGGSSSAQKNDFAGILSEVSRFAESASDLESLQNLIIEIVGWHLPSYNWTGFYMLDPDDPEMLVLGPFRGAPTEHVRIPVNRGICGQAVAENRTVIVDDVSSDPRYLACSLETKSEIVVPIRAHGAVVGEIDIDSHEFAAFSADDRDFIEACAAVMGSFIEGGQAPSSGSK